MIVRSFVLSHLVVLLQRKKNPYCADCVAISLRDHLHIQYPSSLSFCCLDICNIYSRTSDVWKQSNGKHQTILNVFPHLTDEIQLYFTVVRLWGCGCVIASTKK